MMISRDPSKIVLTDFFVIQLSLGKCIADERLNRSSLTEHYILTRLFQRKIFMLI